MALTKSLEVLLCYRGRFSEYTRALVHQLRTLGIAVTYDSEILAHRATFDPASVVEWFTVNDTPQADTTWRAPLKEAVESAEVVVFAVEVRDISENLLNEIRWAILEKVTAFFLVRAPVATVGESAGVLVGILAGFYIMVTGKPEYPEFGFHFFSDDDAAGREADVVVAANRIAAHLARIRQGPLPVMSARNTKKVGDTEQRADRRGRRHLHDIQENVHRAEGRTGAPAQVLEQAIAMLRDHERGTAGQGLGELAIERLRKAEEILLRAQPGPYELAHYITPLALQAAAIETIIHADLKKQRAGLDFRPAILPGTILFSNLAEPGSFVRGDGYWLLLVDCMFIDFLYQLIKVSMLSVRRTLHEENGVSTVHFDPESIADMVRENPAQAGGFYACLRRYAVEGCPDESAGSPPIEVHQSLGAYVRLAERFLLARAYAVIALTGEWDVPPLEIPIAQGVATPEAMRRFVDLAALDYTVRSARLIDHQDPLDALTGGCFLLVAEYLRRAMVAVLDPDGGERSGELEGVEQRVRHLGDHFERRMRDGGAPADLAASRVKIATTIGTIPLYLWQQVSPRLREDQRAGLRAGRMWR